jgi:hypothetical protein
MKLAQRGTMRSNSVGWNMRGRRVRAVKAVRAAPDKADAGERRQARTCAPGAVKADACSLRACRPATVGPATRALTREGEAAGLRCHGSGALARGSAPSTLPTPPPTLPPPRSSACRGPALCLQRPGQQVPGCAGRGRRRRGARGRRGRSGPRPGPPSRGAGHERPGTPPVRTAPRSPAASAVCIRLLILPLPLTSPGPQATSCRPRATRRPSWATSRGAPPRRPACRWHSWRRASPKNSSQESGSSPAT